MFVGSATAQTQEAPVSPRLAPVALLQFVEIPKPPQPPDYLAIKRASDEHIAAEQAEADKRKADCDAAGGHLEDAECIVPPPPPLPVVSYPPAYTQPVYNSYGNNYTAGGTLFGSAGYASPYGNCVLEPGVNNPGYGNPIDWPALYSAPHIGSTVLFFFNHTAVVTGIWSNGDIEVRHQNAAGAPTRYSAGVIRGYR